MCKIFTLIPHIWMIAAFCFVSMVHLGSESPAPTQLNT
jgi:hypothetical protein